jgi:hypothetical protein
VSTVPGFITIEQFAVFLGITPGTARDKVAGRLGRYSWANKQGRTLMLSVEDALLYIQSEMSISV